LIGSLPQWGTDPVELVYSPSPIGWTIRTRPLLLRAGNSIHNAGVATVTALRGVNDNLAEVHIEGGGNYSISAADWFDGMSIRFTHTAGQNTTERLVVTGFAGAFLRDGTSRDISGGMFIGRQDCKFEITITENGGQKFLNIDDRSPDAFAIWAYPPTPPPNTVYNPSTWPGKLVSLAGTLMVRANAVAPNAIAATHYIDAWDNLLTPLYGDGKPFRLPAALSTANPGTDLFLGADGAFSLNPPAITDGNIRQPVAVVRSPGWGIIKLRAPATVNLGGA
jgi:hypothetical protein